MKTFTRSPLGQLSDRDLLAQVQLAALAERQATTHLIALLMELDARRLYLGEGFSSLFTYCTHALHLSEHAAYNRIETARAARCYPIVLELLRAGDLTMTSIRLLAPHLTAENHREVLARARHKSKRDIELLAATLHPRPDVPSTVRKLPAPRPAALPADTEPVEPPREAPPSRPAEVKPLAPERYKIQLTVSRETYQKLRRAQDLLRHAVPNGDPAVIVERALTLLVKELERTKTAATDRPRASRPTKPASRRIPATIKRRVWERDGGQCAFHGPQGRCLETAFLEFHHVVPFAAGGKTTASNIALRCRAHNQYEAEQYFGPGVLPLVREERAVFGSSQELVPERAAGLGRLALVANERDASHGARDDGLFLAVELHAEADVNAVQLQEAAAHRRACEMHARVNGEKSTAAHEHFGAATVHHDNFIRGVARLDDKRLRVVELVDLQTIRPIEIAPGGEIGDGRAKDATHDW